MHIYIYIHIYTVYTYIWRVTKIQQIWINLTTSNFKSFKHYCIGK